MLEGTVGRYGGKRAVALGEHELTYAELDEESNRVANALIKMGVGKDDRIAILLSNTVEFVTLYFGIVKIGAIAVPLDTKYKLIELTSLFNDCQPKVLVVESPLLELIVTALPRLKSVKQVIEVGSDYKRQFLSFQEMVDSSSAQRVDIELLPEDPAHIAYTSGPTLKPRGVVLSHGGLAAEAMISATGFEQTDKDIVVLFALPMHHAFGLVVIVLTSVCRGSTMVILSGLSIDNLLEMIEREQATMFMGVPFIHGLLVNFAEEEGVKHSLSSLRLCGSAGAALPVDVIEKFQKYYNLDIVDFWGMTESSAHVTCQSVNGGIKHGSVGKALPGWKLKIVDDNGHEVPPKQSGEIAVMGPIMTGYYNHPEATARVVRDGWLYTGDTGMVDEDGEVFLTGMKKDMIIAKGQNIYPSDIEEVLCTHPKVGEAAVVGVSDKARGQIIKAFVQLKAGEVATEQEIRSFCLQNLANYKVPKQVVVASSLPRTATGEICKEDLR
ncbi:class I adenylate-forming enzyme family protein [Chloroflexota bacterium]